MCFKIDKYADLIQNAIAYFWNTRNKQLNDQINRDVQDAGNRGAVTGGKQMDGFVALLTKLHWIQVFLKSASIHVTTNCLDISDQRRIGIFNYFSYKETYSRY